MSGVGAGFSFIVDAIRNGAPQFGFKPEKKVVPLR